MEFPSEAIYPIFHNKWIVSNMPGKSSNKTNQAASKSHSNRKKKSRNTRKRNVEFEEVKGNLMVRQRQERKEERQNLINREM